MVEDHIGCFFPKHKFIELLSLEPTIQLILTLCDPMDSSLPGSSIHGIFQARVLEWVAISQPRDQTRVSCIADRRFSVWGTREANIVSGVGERSADCLGSQIKILGSPPTLVDFSRRQCLDVSQLLNYLAQDGECQRFPYIMGILLCLYQVAQMRLIY